MKGAVVAELCRGYWPVLRLLVLGLGIDAAGIASITQETALSLQQLGLQRAHFDVIAAHFFSCASWPNLTCLQLYKCDVTAAGIAWLVQADLPLLELLDLSGNALGQEGFGLLKEGQWPALQTMVLSDTQLGAAAMSHVRQRWSSKLRMLDLSSNDRHLDTAAVTESRKAELQLNHLHSANGH